MSSEEYDVARTLSSIKKYKRHKHNKILYSEISAYIYNLTDEQKGNFVTNLELLLVETMNNNNADNDIMNIVLRIYDHVHLALHQVETLKRDDDDKKNLIAKNLALVSLRFENKPQTTCLY